MIRKIELFEPHFEQTNDFFRFLYRALRECAAAVGIDDPRPLPKVEKPRAHESAWIRCDGQLVFFDMSDHIFSFDFQALERCAVYFKTNLNRKLAETILQDRHCGQHLDKLRPFFSLAGNLNLYNPRDWRNRLGVRQRRLDLCHIVGLYENLIAQSLHPPKAGDPVGPAHYHYWIRVQTRLALQDAGFTGYYRLTSRGNASIEDDLIRPNISQRSYMRRMLECRFTVINTLPHALPPWKISESIAMERPFIIERKPLIELPEEFSLNPDEHYIELLPDWGAFDEGADIDSAHRYRVLQYPSEDDLREACASLKEKLEDNDRYLYMTEKIQNFSRRRMTFGAITDYIRNQVDAVIH
jgi:hypothetical protein